MQWIDSNGKCPMHRWLYTIPKRKRENPLVIDLKMGKVLSHLPCWKKLLPKIVLSIEKWRSILTWDEESTYPKETDRTKNYNLLYYITFYQYLVLAKRCLQCNNWSSYLYFKYQPKIKTITNNVKQFITCPSLLKNCINRLGLCLESAAPWSGIIITAEYPRNKF